MTKNIIEYEFCRDLNPETLAMTLYAVHNTLIYVSEKRDFFKCLQDLHKFSPSVVEHSLMLSMLASAIALQSEEFNNKTVGNVSISALFHDIGLKDLPKGLKEKPFEKMNSKEKTIYMGHPQHGSQIIASIKDVSESVSQAILQHHECNDGSGYPFGIVKANINPIGRILAIADFLVTAWALPEHKNTSLKSLLQLLNDKKETLDKDYIKYALRLTTDHSSLMKTKF